MNVEITKCNYLPSLVKISWSSRSRSFWTSLHTCWMVKA